MHFFSEREQISILFAFPPSIFTLFCFSPYSSLYANPLLNSPALLFPASSRPPLCTHHITSHLPSGTCTFNLFSSARTYTGPELLPSNVRVRRSTPIIISRSLFSFLSPFKPSFLSFFVLLLLPLNSYFCSLFLRHPSCKLMHCMDLRREFYVPGTTAKRRPSVL